MRVCWVAAEFAVGFGGAETPQISAVTHQISHGNHDIFEVPGWLTTANLAGNIGTPDFDVFPGRLCGQQISERLLGNSWIMNLGNYKGGIMVDPNKARLKSCKDTVVLSTARKYVSKAKNFQDFCMKRKRLPKGAKSAIKKWKPKQSDISYHIPWYPKMTFIQSNFWIKNFTLTYKWSSTAMYDTPDVPKI